MNSAHPSAPGDAVGRATLVEWDAARGFGFADDGRRRIFIHIRDFVVRPADLSVGIAVTFVLGADKQGRPCGQRVEIVGSRSRFRWSALGVLAGLLVLPTLAVARLIPAELGKVLGGAAAAASIFAFFAYFDDKRRAQRGEWRTPENVLHFLELIGGWPGGFLARQWLRHKSSKMSFRVWSSFIIGLYQLVSADALLGWPLSRAVRTWLQRL